MTDDVTNLRAAYHDMRVTVAGGVGFIGSHLAVALVNLGARVTVVDAMLPDMGANPHNLREVRDSVRLEQIDTRDSAAMHRLLRGQQVVFNLAGAASHLDSMDRPQHDLELNCRAPLSLLEACRWSCPSARVVFAASRQQYGRPSVLPVTEDHPMRPVDINGIHLVAAEGYHLLYDAVHGLETVSLRLSNTYGPHLTLQDIRQGFIARFIRRAMDGEDIVVYGDGQQLRDMLYVDDAVAAFLLAGVAPRIRGRVFNVAGATPVCLLDIARACAELGGAGANVHLVPWPAEHKQIDVGSVYLDCGRFLEATGWRPHVELRDGLSRTIAFLQEYGAHYWPVTADAVGNG